MFSTTLNPYFIRYNLVVELTFCLQYCLYSSMHAFVKVLEAFLWDFGRCWNDGIRQLVRISGYHFHDSCNYFVPPNHNSALLDLDLVNVEAFWVQPARCVQETSLGLYKHCDMGHYPAESSSYNHKGLQFKWYLIGTKCARKKTSSPHLSTTSSRYLSCWYKEGSFCVFFSCQILTPTIWVLELKSKLIRDQEMLFQFSIVQSWWACNHCSLSFFFVADWTHVVVFCCFMLAIVSVKCVPVFFLSA